MNSILRFFLLFPLFIICGGCAIQQKKSLPPGELGRQFKTIIPGIWQTGMSNGVTYAGMVKKYHANGTAEGVLYMKARQGGLSLVMPEVPFTSKWRVHGDVVETYDMKAAVPGLFKRGHVIRDRLISVNYHKIVTRSESSGDLEIISRIR